MRLLKTIKILFLLLLLCTCLNAQQISGVVFGIHQTNDRETLFGANVFWEGTQQAVTTDVDGKFSISIPQTVKRRLIASFVGYQNDTIDVPIGANNVEFVLIEGFLLDETVVSSRLRGNYLSRITPIQTEVITTSGLQKMACCNLAESFENSASVTVGFTDAVSGAKQIQMLGLSGIYTQMLDENIPTLRGLSSTFGWNYIPSPWLESIQVSKGTSSVINGYESTTGQINLEYKKPDNTETLFINLFGADDGRIEANVTSAVQVGEKTWTGLMLHGSTEFLEHDTNKDGFMDMPKTQLYNIYNRWLYNNHDSEVESRTDVKFLYDKREGGQTSEAIKQLSHSKGYHTNIENNNISLSNKTGFAFGEKEGQSVGIISSYKRHVINSEYGDKHYSGSQNSLYANVLISSYFSNTNHKYTVGGSFMYDLYDESYFDAHPENISELPKQFEYSREEIVPGAFAQYTFSYLERLIFIIGLRADYNSYYGKMLITPRTNFKYNFTENIIFRASAGRGFRSSNIISENIGFLASSRIINVQAAMDLDIEKAWNYGANLTFYIPMPNDKNFTIGLDYYRTYFDNQIITDMEYDKRQIYFYNLSGKSYANAWQADVNVTPLKGFDIFAAFRLNDTKITYNNGGVESITVDKTLTNKYRGLINLSYYTNFEKWKFDFTAQFNGSSRLPSLNGYNAPEERSPAYQMYFAQISKKTKRLDVYVGCENIFDYKQNYNEGEILSPIIEPDNPFSANFDASRIWGPLMGRKLYAGIRLRLGEIK